MLLKQQGEGRLGLARAVLTHHCNHCNHPNVIPHYPEWWSGERLPSNYYFCRVCRDTFSPQELLATYERTKREREVAGGGASAPTGEEVTGRPTQRARLGSQTGSSGGGGTQPRAQPGVGKGKEGQGDPSSGDNPGGEGRGEEEVNWRRELNLREAQITALEREVATLRAQSLTSLHHPQGG